MNRKLCLLDWDGTLRKGYTTLDWLMFLHQQNIVEKSHIQELRLLDAAFQEEKIKYEEFVRDVADIYARAINGKQKSEIAVLADQFVKIDEANLFSFCKPLLHRLRLFHVNVVVISGAPIEPLLAYSKTLAFNRVFGVEVSTSDDGVYTNSVKANYGLLASKIQSVQDVVTADTTVLLAIGNSINDLPLLSVAKQGLFILENDQTPPIQFVHPEYLLESILLDSN